MEEIFGTIDSIVFADEEEGFTVARLKEPKANDSTCIVGIMPGLQPGESIRCKGQWKNHPKHGRQFEVKEFELKTPTDLIGIQKYLESGMIKGIGPAYAERIVREFGTETLQVIDEDPEKLLRVSGIGSGRLKKIKECWVDQKEIRQVMVFLRGHGVSPSYAQKIYKTYGDDSIEKVKSNPFALAQEIKGIGFKSADKIAKNLGIAADSPARIDAGIEYFLWETSNEGNVCYPIESLIPIVKEGLEVAESSILLRLNELIQADKIIQNENLVFVKPLYLAEIGIARELKRIMSAPCILRAVEKEKAIEWTEEKFRMRFAEEQKKAILEGVSEKLLIVTGGPGTGKSTITKAILAICEKLTKSILLAAPTGRAAKRMSEITYKKAFTIHALLEMDFKTGKFKKNRDNPLQCDLIVIDEASMIDTFLMHSLLKAIPSHARVIFVGDIDQLPSVGPGNVLRDMIESAQIPVCILKEIFRQARGSQIVVNSHRINQGVFPDLIERKNSDFLYVESPEPETILNTIIDLLVQLPEQYSFDNLEDIQVLAPMKKGMIGIENLNIVLQAKFNLSSSFILNRGRKFHAGDKVMQIRNNYQKEVFNGDVGFIEEIDVSEQTLHVYFDGKVVPYEFLELDELELAYAVSIHKYQGSECPCIIIPVHTSHFKLLYRNLLYTGITRGKKLVVLVGTKKAIAIAVHNEDVKKRHTGLKARIQEFFKE